MSWSDSILKVKTAERLLQITEEDMKSVFILYVKSPDKKDSNYKA